MILYPCSTGGNLFFCFCLFDFWMGQNLCFIHWSTNATKWMNVLNQRPILSRVGQGYWQSSWEMQWWQIFCEDVNLIIFMNFEQLITLLPHPKKHYEKIASKSSDILCTCDRCHPLYLEALEMNVVGFFCCFLQELKMDTLKGANCIFMFKFIICTWCGKIQMWRIAFDIISVSAAS